MNAIAAQVATFFKRQTPHERALALCRKLDAAQPTEGGDYEDRFVQVGNLLGGEGKSGMVGALTDALDRIESDLMQEATWPDYSPGRGGNDPDHWVSAELQDRIADAQDAFCRRFVADAEAILAAAVAVEAA